MKSTIQVGVCNPQLAKAKSYKLMAMEPGQEIYVMGSDGKTLSNTERTSKGFVFAAGDCLEVRLKGGEVTITSTQSKQKYTFSLKKVSEAEQKKLVYCVGLSDVQDRVQIVPK